MVKLFFFEIYFVLKNEKKYPCEKVLKTAQNVFLEKFNELGRKMLHFA